ncbi:hypothetical protein SXCC_04393 [Gluconacetobacter sp. SXCC-1]|nr:hypothetical protein SXCC_04393 [Gluconacetobacter sp. SXCC-1]
MAWQGMNMPVAFETIWTVIDHFVFKKGRLPLPGRAGHRV